MSSIAADIFGIGAKDLMCSEARYHSSNNAFVSMVVMQPPRAVRKQLRDREGLLMRCILSLTLKYQTSGCLRIIIKEIRNCKCTGRRGTGGEWAWK